MFLLPGLVITWFIIGTKIPEPTSIEIRRYLLARQNEDGGWGLHTEGESTVFGTAMNYTIMRILGADAEDLQMVKARGVLHKLGGANYGPLWAKFWLCTLGVMSWDCCNPMPPELWLLPDWLPIAPWRWWIHMRQVYLPMSYIYSKRYSHPLTPLTKELRKELYVQPFEEINFAAHRTSVAPTDNYHPKTWVLNLLMWIVFYIWNPFLLTAGIKKRAEEWTWDLIRREDENTDYACLAPVNAPLNTLCCFLHDGPESYSVKRHVERLQDYLWVMDIGMTMCGTNGVQVWDTAFSIQAVVEADLAGTKKWRSMLERAQCFLEHHQILEEVPEREICYRQQRKGAWPFSTRTQGYTVSDCTAEALKATLQLQNMYGYPRQISDRRIFDAIDVLLTMQNRSGGFSSYEPTRGSELLEWLNAAEVFGRIMVEYDYPECTTAVVTVFSLFQQQYPDYRSDEIQKSKDRALTYIRRAQRPDGSWYGSWGICFTYGGMFALESLASIGETYANSERVRRGCDFLLSKQMEDGGWGESYRSCEEKVYIHHEKSQVVNTSWAAIALMNAEYLEQEPLKKAMQMMMRRQQKNGEWLQENIEGVFNCTW